MANGTLAASQLEMLSQSGTGIITVVPPATNTNQTLTLPNLTGTVSTLNVGTAVASTSGTSIDFTNIPAGVKRITVMWSGVSWNGTVTPLIQLGDSGGIETTGYSSIGGFTSTSSSVGTATQSAGFGILGNWGADVLFSGSFIISLLDASSNTWVVQGVLFADSPTTDYSLTSSGVKSLSTTLDRVRITSTAAVTFDAGTINIMYEG